MKKLLKLALLIGGIAAVSKLVGAKKAEWKGLSESEVRAKLDAKLPDRMPPEKQALVADKVVTKMRHRGILREDAPEMEAEGQRRGRRRHRGRRDGRSRRRREGRRRINGARSRKRLSRHLRDQDATRLRPWREP